ncbi:hypothetical protein CGLO_17996 [Colletotrichum gloeosporioides Cg-14]|uniref:Uncharacterized protein n=1 Tax=Colletotrichum gloeosporioides (strain Cg-14) TaxID=1237896 RepID=T0L541_COLGC|nr:hypothetical protein CGLO_17996 [Colletotrichum gloeosporioides Cg-14]
MLSVSNSPASSFIKVRTIGTKGVYALLRLFADGS